MQLTPKEIVLKDGTRCLLRAPLPEDAEQFLAYLKATAAETPFLTRYPEEVTLTVEEERVFLEDKCNDPKGGFFSAWIDGRLAGNASFYPVGLRMRFMHRAAFGIAILQEFCGRGLGEILLNEAVRAAKSAGYEQMELEVAANNTRAVKLYEKCGFVRYGTRPNAFKYKDGGYADEHLMVRKL